MSRPQGLNREPLRIEMLGSSLQFTAQRPDAQVGTIGHTQAYVRSLDPRHVSSVFDVHREIPTVNSDAREVK